MKNMQNSYNLSAGKETVRSSATESQDNFQFSVDKHMDLSKEEKLNLELIESYKRYKWWVDVKVMKAGESFGELALKNDAPRAATIHCRTKCFLAVINRPDYDKFLKRMHHKQL